MVLTLTLSVAASLYLGNTASNTLLRKNHDFASLLGDYLNNQIYRRFTMPTISIFGRVALRQPEQYRALDQVVQSIIQELQVEGLRIYAHDNTVAYSINPDELGSTELGGAETAAAATAGGPIFAVDSDMPYWRAFLSLNIKPETFRLRTNYPLRIENSPSSSGGEGPVLGVLEFSQDITRDMASIVRFQQLVLAVTLLSSGMLMGVILFLVRRAERALAARVAKEQRLLNELHQHERLASMGRVVASIAHEIRNPLGIISSSAELLNKRTEELSVGSRRILAAIHDETKRLSRTVSDFLDYARPRQPRLDPVDVGGVVGQALAFLGSDLNERDIGVVRAGELDEPLWVLGDKDLLYRAFYNIMGNAVQAMGAAGTLTITMKRRAGDGNEVILIFQDTGPGFSEEAISKMLDPFFTTKDDGTGLGLPIVNSIIVSHGGYLSLGNAEEGGAEVQVVLPGATPGESAPGRG